MSGPDSAQWLLFLASLSGRSASTPRVRLWRSLKELGAATLRDGVTLLPVSDSRRSKLKTIAKQVEADGGSAWLLELPPQNAVLEEQLRAAFNRKGACLEFAAHVAAVRQQLPRLDEAGARRQLRQLQRELDTIAGIDFFPGETRATARAALDELVALANTRFSPQEPSAASGEIERLEADGYRGRLWATRRRLWVDRVASAWLIRRCIDSEARFVWVERPEDCPREALGFDFDGAAFTHVGDRVTFEVLLTSFGLETEPGLMQLARLVHYLDVGGPAVAEAAGFEAVLAGLRDGAPDDDALLEAVTPVLDALRRRFSLPRR